MTELTAPKDARRSLYDLELIVERYEEDGGPPVRDVHDVSLSIVLSKGKIDFEAVVAEVRERHYPDWNHWLLIRWEEGGLAWLLRCQEGRR